jgi:hypothetical protein
VLDEGVVAGVCGEVDGLPRVGCAVVEDDVLAVTKVGDVAWPVRVERGAVAAEGVAPIGTARWSDCSPRSSVRWAAT